MQFKFTKAVRASFAVGILPPIAAISIAAVVCGAEHELPDSAKPKNQPTQLYEYLLEGMEHARESLRTARFRIFGEMRRMDEGRQELNGAVVIEGAVDFVDRKVRFDKTEPVMLEVFNVQPEGLTQPTEGPAAVPGKTNAAPVPLLAIPPAVRPQTKKYIRVPGRTVYWSRMADDEPEDLTRQPGIIVDIEGSLRYELPFDLRAIGLMVWADLGRHTLPDIVDIYRDASDEVLGVEKLPGMGDSYRVDMRFDLGTKDHHVEGRRILVIDATQGFTVKRLEISRLSNGKSTDTPINLSEVRWNKNRGVWLPEHWKLQFNDGHNEFAYDLAFVWNGVNEPVPAKLFSYEDFGAPIGTPVFDQRAGRQMFVEELGKKSTLAPPATRSGRAAIWLVAGVVPLLAGAAAFAWKAHRRRAQNSSDRSQRGAK